jgi:hypothetical protein
MIRCNMAVKSRLLIKHPVAGGIVSAEVEGIVRMRLHVSVKTIFESESFATGRKRAYERSII